MLLTFIIDPPFVFCLGYFFAAMLPYTLQPPIYTSRAFAAMLFTATIFNVAVAISYVQFPDWMWMYFFDTRFLSMWEHGLTLAISLIIYYALGIGGFFWGIHHRVHIWRTIAALLGMSGLCGAIFFDRYFHVGTTAEFFAGTAPTLPQSPLAALYNITVPLMLAVGSGLLWWARSQKKDANTN